MRTPVIILIVAVVLIIIGAVAAIMMMGGNTTATTLTQNGTKIDFYNNNTQDWTHVEFVILNDTTVITLHRFIMVKFGLNQVKIKHLTSATYWIQ